MTWLDSDGKYHMLSWVAHPCTPPSTGHSCTPPSTGHSCTPPSAGHSCTPPSAGHSCTPPSTAHSSKPPFTAHSCTPPSATLSSTPPSAAHPSPPSAGKSLFSVITPRCSCLSQPCLALLELWKTVILSYSSSPCSSFFPVVCTVTPPCHLIHL